MDYWETTEETLRSILEDIESRARRIAWVNPDIDLSQNPDFVVEVKTICHACGFDPEDLMDTLEKILYRFSWFRGLMTSFADYHEAEDSYKVHHDLYVVAAIRYLTSLTPSEMAEVEKLLKTPDFYGFFDSEFVEGIDE